MPAQTISISDAMVCAAQEVSVPVFGSSILNIGAITLYIGFDTLNLTYDTIENVDPQIADMSANLMSSPKQLAIAWSNISPINIPGGKLFDIKFIANGQNAGVYHNPGCEFANPSGTVIPVLYTDGGILSGLPVISSQPIDTTITEGQQAFFTILSPNATSLFWKESQDNGTSWLTLEDGGIYSGTHSSRLSLTNVPLTFNHYKYQCFLTKDSCSTTTSNATLSVDELASTASSDNQGINNMNLSPVPFYDHSVLSFSTITGSTIQIRVRNMLGETLYSTEYSSCSSKDQHIAINTQSWHPGVYFFTCTVTTSDNMICKTIKGIKSNN